MKRGWGADERGRTGKTARSSVEADKENPDVRASIGRDMLDSFQLLPNHL